jgi:hypothetical protein
VRALLNISLLLGLCSCGQPSPVAKQANNTADLNLVVAQANAAANAAKAAANGVSPTNAQQAGTNAVAAEATSAGRAIPAALQGRWGLTPGDCTSPLAAAKGLLVVNADAIRFYEASAAPSLGVESDSQSMTGTFRFSGEGKTWTRWESLKRTGDKLTRTETNPAASYTYAKC